MRMVHARREWAGTHPCVSSSHARLVLTAIPSAFPLDILRVSRAAGERVPKCEGGQCGRRQGTWHAHYVALSCSPRVPNRTWCVTPVNLPDACEVSACTLCGTAESVDLLKDNHEYRQAPELIDRRTVRYALRYLLAPQSCALRPCTRNPVKLVSSRASVGAISPHSCSSACGCIRRCTYHRSPGGPAPRVHLEEDLVGPLV